MEFEHEETSGSKSENQLQISVILDSKHPLEDPLTVVCRSALRASTSYQILDEQQRSMSFQPFCYGLGQFNQLLVEELNILLEDEAQIKHGDFRPIAKLAVDKCESRYGNGVEAGDCIITIQ